MNYHRLAGVVWAFTLAGIISGMTLLPGWRSEAAAQEVNGLTLSAQVGLDGYCRKGDWIPIRVTIGNPGPDLGARVKVAYREKITYASDILLPAASNRRLFLYAYDQNFYRDLVVILEDGKTILAQEELSVTCLSDSYRLIGLLVDDPAAFAPLADIPLANGDVRLAQLAPDELPDQAQGWSGLDVLVISGVDTGRLSDAQRRALQAWLAGGGKLLVTGGPNWQENTAAVDAYLPLGLNGTRTMTGVSALQVYSEIPLPEDSTAILSTGRTRAGAEVQIEQMGIPLIASRRVGLGTVYLLTADPGLQPLRDWSGMQELYARMLELEEPAVAWDNGDWESRSANTALSALAELGLPSFLIICGWLGIYLVVIGPANYLVLRRLKRRELAWLTIPALVLVFTVIAYLTGFVYRGRKPILNRLAVVQAWDGSQSAQVNALVGVYSPWRTRYTLQTEDPFKFRPFESDPAGMSGTWRSVQDGSHTYLEDVQVEIGGVQAIGLEGYLPAMTFDHDLAFTFSSTNPKLSGRITNTSAFALRDAILVTSAGVQELGDLYPNDTRDVNVRYVIGSSTSPFYTLDYSDIAGVYSYYYNADDSERRREALIEAILDEGGGVSWGVYLMGWVEEPVLPVSLQDRTYDAVDTTFYIAMLSPTIAYTGNRFLLPPSFFSWNTVQEVDNSYGYPYSSGVYSFPPGGYTTIFHPGVPLRFSSVERLRLWIEVSEPPEKFTVSLWDYGKGGWQPIEIVNWGDLLISEPWRYVSPEGEIRLNLDSELENDWIEIETTNFTLEVRR